MPSRVDPNHPATGVPVSKAASRANWAAARFELEHGGFFTQAGTGALERQTQGKLRECISAADFGALGDNSGTTVAQWLSGGTHSRGAADLAELRAMTGIADLALTDTIDWAALTAAKNALGATPVRVQPGKHYKLSRPLVFAQGGLDGQQPGTVARLTPTVAHAHDVIQLAPTSSNAPFAFRHLYLQGGAHGVHASSAAANNWHIWEQSVFQDIYIGGCSGDGFFFEDLWAIGVLFLKIRCENNGGWGIRFTGRAMLNGAQIVNSRAVDNASGGFLFENTGVAENIPAVAIFGAIAEANDGPGMHFKGYNATLYDPYFENNNADQVGEEPDLLLSHSTDGTVKSTITAIGAYFGPALNPSNIRIGKGTGSTQSLTLIQPSFPLSAIIDCSAIELTADGLGPWQAGFLQNQITGGMPALRTGSGFALAGASIATTTPANIGIPADSPTGAVLLVLAAKPDADGGQTAMYMVRRNQDGTITPTLVSGTDILTFAVDAGNITVAAQAGQASYSIMGY